jgi:hypothetical protein
VPGVDGIPEARQHIGNGIVHHRTHQLALMTPGTSPFSTRLRMQIRHSWKSR